MAPVSLLILLKLVHVLAAFLFLGTGFGSFFYKWLADRTGSVEVVLWCQRAIVLADWLFTVPSAALLPITGLVLAYLYGLPLTTPWILIGIGGYVVAGITWLPAAWAQLRMRALAQRAYDEGTELPESFYRLARLWLYLGAPSFLAALLTVLAMIDRGQSVSWLN